jgi:hypothetical protein
VHTPQAQRPEGAIGEIEIKRRYDWLVLPAEKRIANCSCRWASLNIAESISQRFSLGHPLTIKTNRENQFDKAGNPVGIKSVIADFVLSVLLPG